MINFKKLWSDAKAQAKSFFSGGLLQKATALEEQIKENAVSGGTNVVLGVTGFGIGHIPLGGPTLQVLYDKAVAAPLSDLIQEKTVDSLLNKAKERHKVIQYQSAQVATMLPGLFAQYTTVRRYVRRDRERQAEAVIESKSCEPAFQAAYTYALAKSCLSDLEKNLALLRTFLEILEAEVVELKPAVLEHKQCLTACMKLLEFNHPQKKCLSVQSCYWASDDKGPKGPMMYDNNINDSDL